MTCTVANYSIFRHNHCTFTHFKSMPVQKYRLEDTVLRAADTQQHLTYPP